MNFDLAVGITVAFVLLQLSYQKFIYFETAAMLTLSNGIAKCIERAEYTNNNPPINGNVGLTKLSYSERTPTKN